MEKKEKLQISFIYAGNFIIILIIESCVSLLKKVKTDSNWSYIVEIVQEGSPYGKNTHEMGPKKYLKNI